MKFVDPVTVTGLLFVTGEWENMVFVSRHAFLCSWSSISRLQSHEQPWTTTLEELISLKSNVRVKECSAAWLQGVRCLKSDLGGASLRNEIPLVISAGWLKAAVIGDTWRPNCCQSGLSEAPLIPLKRAAHPARCPMVQPAWEHWLRLEGPSWHEKKWNTCLRDQNSRSSPVSTNCSFHLWRWCEARGMCGSKHPAWVRNPNPVR